MTTLIDCLDNPKVISQLKHNDSILTKLFHEVKNVNWQVLKRPPYVALIGSIIGQKIRYTQAKKIRSNLFKLLGTSFTIDDFIAIDEKKLLKTGISNQQLKIIQDVNLFLLKLRDERKSYKNKNNSSIKQIFRRMIKEVRGIRTSFAGIGLRPRAELV